MIFNISLGYFFCPSFPILFLVSTILMLSSPIKHSLRTWYMRIVFRNDNFSEYCNWESFFSDGLDKFSAIFIAQKSQKIWAFCQFNKCCYWCTDHRETVQVCREREEPLADKLLVEVRNKVCWKLFLWSNQELTVTFTADSAKSNWAVPQPGLVFGVN